MTPKIILHNELNNPNMPTAKQFQEWVNGIFQHVENHVPENVSEVCIRIVDEKESTELNENFRQKQAQRMCSLFQTSRNSNLKKDPLVI